MKALKIIAVTAGTMLIMTGIGFLVGSFLTGIGQQAFDRELARQGFGGPARGTVIAADDIASGAIFTVSYTDQDGNARAGRGTVSDGSNDPSVGDEVTVIYLLDNPNRIVIINLGITADFAAIGNALRIGGIPCLVLGAVLLTVGIIGLTRRPQPAPAAGP